MATALERVMAGPAPAEVVKEHKPRPAALLYGPLAIVLAALTLVVANVVAILPGRAAARVQPAPVLRSE